MFSTGKDSISLNDILNTVTEESILSYYIGIDKIPCFINSPLRIDKKPSFGIYSSPKGRIYYTDLSTGDKGGVFDLLGKLWKLSYIEVLTKINSDLDKIQKKVPNIKHFNIPNKKSTNYKNSIDLKVKIREWKPYDIEYWESYGINLKCLKYADVYPISHIFIIKEGRTNCYKADKYAYVYVEHKEGNTTLKVYQPYRESQKGKWINKHDKSVISLWTKIPAKGEKLCICSSLKDALCLWINTKIPSIAPQGEGYKLSNTVIEELKSRYNKIYILFDNDKAGIENSNALSLLTGFTNVILPEGYGKDVSDIYHNLKDKKEFNKLLLPLFN